MYPSSVSSIQHSVHIAFFTLTVHQHNTHTQTAIITLSFFDTHKLINADTFFSLTHTHHLSSVCLVDTHIRPGRRCMAWTIGLMMKALQCKWRLNYHGQSVGGLCVCVRMCVYVCACACGEFTQQAPGSRALRWLVKTPSRALGFELAFCQPSCQREAGTLREQVCVLWDCVCTIRVCSCTSIFVRTN